MCFGWGGGRGGRSDVEVLFHALEVEAAGLGVPVIVTRDVQASGLKDGIVVACAGAVDADIESDTVSMGQMDRSRDWTAIVHLPQVGLETRMSLLALNLAQNSPMVRSEPVPEMHWTPPTYAAVGERRRR